MVKQHVPQRTLTIALAAIVLAILSLLSLATPLLAEDGGLPPLIVAGAVVFGALGLVAVAGLWTRTAWGAWIAVIVSAFNGVSAAPGLAFAPSAMLRMSAIVTVAGSLLIIVLVLLPSSRRAYS